MSGRCEIERLSGFLDGELPVGERAALERHLAACPDCRRALEELRRASELVRSLPTRSAPRGFARRVMERVAAIEAEEAAPGARRAPRAALGGRPRFRWSAWTSAAAAAAAGILLAVVGTAVLRTGTPPGAPGDRPRAKAKRPAAPRASLPARPQAPAPAAPEAPAVVPAPTASPAPEAGLPGASGRGHADALEIERLPSAPLPEPPAVEARVLPSAPPLPPPPAGDDGREAKALVTRELEEAGPRPEEDRPAGPPPAAAPASNLLTAAAETLEAEMPEAEAKEAETLVLAAASLEEGRSALRSLAGRCGGRVEAGGGENAADVLPRREAAKGLFSSATSPAKAAARPGPASLAPPASPAALPPAGSSAEGAAGGSVRCVVSVPAGRAEAFRAALRALGSATKEELLAAGAPAPGGAGASMTLPGRPLPKLGAAPAAPRRGLRSAPPGATARPRPGGSEDAASSQAGAVGAHGVRPPPASERSAEGGALGAPLPSPEAFVTFVVEIRVAPGSE